MSTDTIDKLYKNYEILSDATDKSKVRIFSVFVVISENFPPRDTETRFYRDNNMFDHVLLQ